MKKSIKFITYLFLAFFLVACTSTAPLTGRKQLKLVSDESVVADSIYSYNQFITQTKSQGLLMNNTREGRRLNEIGKRVSKAVEKYMYKNEMGDKVKYLNWEFNLIKGEEINAFAMPGGKIVFYTGILPILQNDAGIAFVMGHEIGHVIGGHHAEGHSNRQIAQITSTITGMISGNDVLTDLVNKGLSIGILKFNRTQEYEADKYGLIFMAMAGYNPLEGIKAEERLAKLSKNKGSDFLSTHPTSEKRLKALRDFLPEAMKYYNKK